ncbi:MAG: cysteine desulfurase family protein [Candidatus Ranarchaeia archaeon]
MGRQVYFDYQSSKPVDEQVVAAMKPYWREIYGNPASLHQVGDDATEALEGSREVIADFINAEKDEIVFTSTATESINLGITGFVLRNKAKGNHIIISEVEHISIHNIAKYLQKQGFEVSKVPVDQYGRIRIRKLEERIKKETILISIGYASNEIGSIQPIREIGEIAKERNIAFHCDAVAAEGLIPLDVKRDGIDLLTISSNDIYGPKGAAILYIRKGVRVNPVIIGGGQEKGLRSGTENIPAIVGMRKAVEIMQTRMSSEVKRLQKYRDRLIKEVLASIPDSHLNGHPTIRLANNAHFRFDAIEGESLLLSLKDKGIAVSTGSACSSKTLEASHTLIATGLLHEEAHGSLELTCGRFNQDSDVDVILEVLPEVVRRLRRMSPLYKPKE